MSDSRTLSHSVYEQIKSNIINGVWAMGQRLTENELSNSLHVSRTPVRWAMMRLNEEGLLSYNKNVGYRVRTVTVSDVIEIYKIRTALEQLSFREAAQKMTDQDYDDIEALLAKSQEAVDSGDEEGLLESSSLFNLKIYQHADMPRLTMIQENLQEYIKSLRRISFGGGKHDRRVKALQEHKLILTSMRRLDYPTLAVQIDDHLNRSKEYILSVARHYETKNLADL